MQTQYFQIDNIHLFIWSASMWLIAHFVETQREEIVLGKKEWHTTPFFAVLVFLPIVIMTVFGRPRSDTYAYVNHFLSLPSSFSGGWDAVLAAKEPGFELFNVVIKWIFGENVTVYRMALALVQAIPVVFVLRYYSENYLFAIYVFIAGGYHLAWMMNGIRQFIAVAIIFAATPWIIEKKYFRSVLVVLLAASFHRSALFILPVIFIVQGEAWNWKTLLFSFAAVIATYVFANNIEIFEEMSEDVGYSIEAVREMGDDGAHPLRFVVSAVPMVLSFLARDRMRAEGNRIFNVCANMSVITAGITLIAVVTSGIMVGRMPVYTSLYNLILLPHVIKVYFGERMSPLIMALAVGFYFLYFVVVTGF